MKKILFYYPQHFNRSAQSSNPFFDRLLDACDTHGIEYDLMEEPDPGTDKPRNPKAKKGDTFFWTVTAIRKLTSIALPHKTFHVREKYVAKIFNLITFNRFKYRAYITISGSMYHLFAHLNPSAKVYDMQHGILYKQHSTFFDMHKLRPEYYQDSLQFLFWGKGYEGCFVKGDEAVLSGRTHIVGFPIQPDSAQSGLTDHSDRRDIVVSLQFTHDIQPDRAEKMKADLCRFLDNTAKLPVKVLLKHHPRYNNSIDLEDLFVKYRNVELAGDQLSGLYDRTLLHATFSSTTAFEFAQFGIPTFFINSDDKVLGSHLFYEEFQYPLYHLENIDRVVSRLSNSANYMTDSETVHEWYRKFYSPFDKVAFLELLK